jgi:hypothetical protein
MTCICDLEVRTSVRSTSVLGASMPVRKVARQWLLFAHVVISLGWMGAGAANVVLAVTAGMTSSSETRRACYQLINRLDFALVIPLAFGTLASGVVISLATKWGLFRYWWVLVKLVLTLAMILFSTFGVGVWVEVSMAATASVSEASPVASTLVVGAAANIVSFLFMTWASIAKPWPRRPGRRRRASSTPGIGAAPMFRLSVGEGAPRAEDDGGRLDEHRTS